MSQDTRLYLHTFSERTDEQAISVTRAISGKVSMSAESDHSSTAEQATTKNKPLARRNPQVRVRYFLPWGSVLVVDIVLRSHVSG